MAEIDASIAKFIEWVLARGLVVATWHNHGDSCKPVGKGTRKSCGYVRGELQPYRGDCRELAKLYAEWKELYGNA